MSTRRPSHIVKTRKREQFNIIMNVRKKGTINRFAAREVRFVTQDLDSAKQALRQYLSVAELEMHSHVIFKCVKVYAR